MTLTDIIELKEKILMCGDADEAAAILDEYGEDCGSDIALRVFDSVKNTGEKKFSFTEAGALFCGGALKCPSCGNASPDKILSNSSELLSDDPDTHFGCCECGEQFTAGA